MNVTKQVVFVAKDGCVDELKELLSMMVEPSRRELGCELYNIYQLDDNKNSFLVVESWESEEALEGHRHTPHYKIYKEKFEALTAHKEFHHMTMI